MLCVAGRFASALPVAAALNCSRLPIVGGAEFIGLASRRRGLYINGVRSNFQRRGVSGAAIIKMARLFFP
jgi:hypothetical protein